MSLLVLDELRIVLGDTLAPRFLAVFARTHVNVPKAARGSFFAELERVIGTEAAERFVRHFAGQPLYIPGDAAEERERRNAEIVARVSSGESFRSIARSYRTVHTSASAPCAGSRSR
jgi:hypothetical protein